MAVIRFLLGVLAGYLLGYRAGTQDGRRDGQVAAYGEVANIDAWREARRGA